MMSRLNIILVEDSEMDELLIKRCLELDGYKPAIHRIDNAEEMINAMQSKRYDIILSDYEIPGFGGNEALEIWRDCGQDIPFIIVSGEIGEEKAAQLMRHGAHDFIRKENLQRLVPAIKRELHETRERQARRQAEAKLKESEQKFKSLVANVPGAIYRCAMDDKRTIHFISDRVFEFCAYPASDFINNSVRSYSSLIHPDDVEWVEHTIKSAVDKKKSFDIEYRILDKAKKIVWLYEKGQAIFDRKGDVNCLDGAIFDISDRKRVEQQLYEEKERAQVTLQSIGDGVISTDAFGLIEYINPIGEGLTGWTHQDAQGKPLDEVFQVIDEANRKPAENPAWRCLKEGRVIALVNHPVLVRRDGTEVAIEDSAAPIRDRCGEICGVILIFHDVGKTRKMAKKMAYQATHDTLTGLINRQEFEHRLNRVCENLQPGQQHALLYLDLDQFKIVNDSCGHIAGDELLRQVALLFRQNVRERDTLGRLGGDEFGVLLEHCILESARRIAESMRESLENFRFVWQDKGFSLGVSIGLVAIDQDCCIGDNILSLADSACYAAKNQGRNRVQLYQLNDDELYRQRGEMQWVARIQDGLRENRFCLYFQPIRSIKDGRNIHYEILLRMVGEKGEIILPGAFIPAAERYGQMIFLDQWVINQVFQTINQRNIEKNEQACFAINISGQSIGDSEFLDYVVKRLQEYRVVPNTICFEITETSAIGSFSYAMNFITELKKLGFKFSLDDFGSGLSSFAYLKSLPVDYLKIDGIFVKDIVDDPIDYAMVKSIHDIAKVMGIESIAEFVENDEILDKLTEIGIDYVQGYGIDKPCSLSKLTNCLT